MHDKQTYRDDSSAHFCTLAHKCSNQALGSSRGLLATERHSWHVIASLEMTCFGRGHIRTARSRGVSNSLSATYFVSNGITRTALLDASPRALQLDVTQCNDFAVCQYPSTRSPRVQCVHVSKKEPPVASEQITSRFPGNSIEPSSKPDI